MRHKRKPKPRTKAPPLPLPTLKKFYPLKPIEKSFYPPMEPQEYEKALDYYDIPAAQFADMIGVGWRQGQRYREGTTTVPATAAKLIRTAIRHRLAPDEIG